MGCNAGPPAHLVFASLSNNTPPIASAEIRAKFTFSVLFFFPMAPLFFSFAFGGRLFVDYLLYAFINWTWLHEQGFSRLH